MQVLASKPENNRLKKIKKNPEIEEIKVSRGNLIFVLNDERQVIVPVTHFPKLKGITLAGLRKWQVIDGVHFTFSDTDEIYHVKEILGGNN